MLDAVPTQNNAIFANAAGWSAPKVLGILTLALGILALAATVYLMWKHRVFRAPPDAAEEFVLRNRASYALLGLLFAILGVLSVSILILVLVGNQSINYVHIMNGFTMPMIGLMHTWSAIYDRLEYDETGIRHFSASGRSKLIRWSELETITYGRFSRTLELTGGGVRMYVRLRNPKAPRLLEFMADRVTGEMRDTVEKQLPRKPDGKGV